MEKYVDVRVDDLGRQLEVSAHDRDRLRDQISNRATRTEFDLLLDRVSSLERTQARILGGLAVVVILFGAIGVVLRYVVG